MDMLVSKDNGIVHIVFHRADKKNAITPAMYQTMVDALKDAEADQAVRVILFSGSEQAFTAGNDLEDFLKTPPVGKDNPVYQFLWEISHATKPIVAAVSGLAVGIGTTMLLHCDLVYAAEKTKFSMPFTQLGLCPEAAVSLLLPQVAGYQRAAEKILLGEVFLAEEAHEMGMVNKILPVNELLPFAQAQAAKLAALPSTSIRISKQLMKQGMAVKVEGQIETEVKHFAAMLQAPAAKEAFMAFFEKRKPDFSQC